MAMSDADQELMELQRSVMTQGHAAGLPHGPTAADPEAITTFEARRAAQREAWGQFAAIAPITIGNALAFVPGAAVPLEHVIRYKLWEQELIVRVATPELARVGKVFASDEEFDKANPHYQRRKPLAPELHPAALDPRGGAAHLDTEGVHGPVITPATDGPRSSAADAKQPAAKRGQAGKDAE